MSDWGDCDAWDFSSGYLSVFLVLGRVRFPGYGDVANLSRLEDVLIPF